MFPRNHSCVSAPCGRDAVPAVSHIHVHNPLDSLPPQKLAQTRPDANIAEIKVVAFQVQRMQAYSRMETVKMRLPPYEPN